MKRANSFSSLKPIHKESYAGDKKDSNQKKKKGRFEKLRSKILKNWNPKKVGL